MNAQAPTHTAPDLASAVEQARKDVKRTANAMRDANKSLAQLDAALAESAGFTFVEVSTTALEGEGENHE